MSTPWLTSHGLFELLARAHHYPCYTDEGTVAMTPLLYGHRIRLVKERVVLFHQSELMGFVKKVKRLYDVSTMKVNEQLNDALSL